MVNVCTPVDLLIENITQDGRLKVTLSKNFMATLLTFEKWKNGPKDTLIFYILQESKFLLFEALKGMFCNIAFLDLPP